MNNSDFLIEKQYILQMLKDILKRVENCPEERIRSDFTITNTGITEIPNSNISGYSECIDLGGRKIEMVISLPDTRTLFEAIQEQKNGTPGNQKQS